MIKIVKKFNLCFIFVFMSFASFSQLSDSAYDDDMRWQVSMVFANAKNVWDQKTFDKEVKMTSVDLSFYRSDFEIGGAQSSYRLKVISDFIPQLISPLFEKSRNILRNNAGVPIFTSLLGWYNRAWAVVNTDSFQTAVGLHAGGYTYGVEGDGFPYAAVGPAVIVDYLLPFVNLQLHYEGSYGFSFLLDPEPERPFVDGEKPAFLNQIIQLRRGRFFLSYEFVNGIHETGNKITRSQFGLGFVL